MLRCKRQVLSQEQRKHWPRISDKDGVAGDSKIHMTGAKSGMEDNIGKGSIARQEGAASLSKT